MEPLVIPDLNYVESHSVLLAKDPNERERYKRSRPPLHVRVMEVGRSYQCHRSTPTKSATTSAENPFPLSGVITNTLVSKLN
ncbi:MAG: uncharacterized protein KVP18_001599 [Porospora cf. gigantea A]|uniref:uncharacterized protein n=1 Tax=Porospora cf. gigantea A TaxID=2853593 RepID=UPI00355A8726|nr:MAG: hypothetical protein KVP18_001599 [Porospora cf. gigantea A]